MRNLVWPAALILLGFATSCTTRPSPITQEELVRRTQTMFDAVTSGDKTPWNNYVADDVIYFDEKGHLFDKKSLVA
ncbi:MAG TPA: hypothetical protein VFP40_04885, partial [Terriglobales bacterium]|nr:hypothetical protein [Terriglobales bacterium]